MLERQSKQKGQLFRTVPFDFHTFKKNMN